MSTDEHEQPGVPDGIQDTGDLTRIWDALELLAGRVDRPDPHPAAEGEEPPPTDP